MQVAQGDASRVAEMQVAQEMPAGVGRQRRGMAEVGGSWSFPRYGVGELGSCQFRPH